MVVYKRISILTYHKIGSFPVSGYLDERNEINYLKNIVTAFKIFLF